MSTKRFNKVFFHSPCSDGVAALWCAKQYLIENFISVPTRAGTDPEGTFTGENILFVDLCPSFEFIKNVSKTANKITILDHHKSALDMYCENKDLLETINNLEIELDMDRSGCQIVWDYFFPERPRPWFIDYVGDRDLWKWSLPNSKVINAAIYENGYLDPNEYDKLNELLDDEENKKRELTSQGNIITKLQQRELEIGVNKAVRAEFKVGQKKYKVWLGGNISLNLRSELGNLLVNKKFPDGTDPDFSVFWVYDPKSNEWWLSFRGGEQSPDLSVIARKLGGGGHEKSSGGSLKGGKTLYDFFKIL